MIGKQVFFDPTGERALVLRWLAWVAGTLSALVVVVFVAILMIVHRPINDSFDDRLAAHASIRCAWAPTCSAGHGITVANAADPELLRSAAGLATELREQERTLKTRHPQAEVLDRHPVPAPLRGSNQRSLSIGFYVNLGHGAEVRHRRSGAQIHSRHQAQHSDPAHDTPLGLRHAAMPVEAS